MAKILSICALIAAVALNAATAQAVCTLKAGDAASVAAANACMKRTGCLSVGTFVSHDLITLEVPKYGSVSFDGNLTFETSGYLTLNNSQYLLTLTGGPNAVVSTGPKGIIVGGGAPYWPPGNVDINTKPKMLKLSLPNSKINGLYLKDSPAHYIQLEGSSGSLLKNIKISSAAPAKSNTHGIDVLDQHVVIKDSYFTVQDDCISFQNTASYIDVRNVYCNTTNGISVGLLGKNGGIPNVTDITVTNCTLKDSQNGIRFKIAPNTNPIGYAKNIVYQDIILDNVINPIIIYQNYCDSGKIGNVCLSGGFDPAGTGTQNIPVGPVTLRNVKGTSASTTVYGTYIVCHPGACTDFTFENIDLVPNVKNITGIDVIPGYWP